MFFLLRRSPLAISRGHKLLALSPNALLPRLVRAETQQCPEFARRLAPSPACPCPGGPHVSLGQSGRPSRHAPPATSATNQARALPLHPRHDKSRTTVRTACARAPQPLPRPRQPAAWPPNFVGSSAKRAPNRQ